MTGDTSSTNKCSAEWELCRTNEYPRRQRRSLEGQSSCGKCVPMHAPIDSSPTGVLPGVKIRVTSLIRWLQVRVLPVRKVTVAQWQSNESILWLLFPGNCPLAGKVSGRKFKSRER